jgi:hypothetical protein
MLICGPTLMVAWARLPSESVTLTTSAASPVAPAVYTPAAVMAPPEPAVTMAKVKFWWLPPAAPSVTLWRGETLPEGRPVKLTPGPT